MIFEFCKNWDEMDSYLAKYKLTLSDGKIEQAVMAYWNNNWLCKRQRV